VVLSKWTAWRLGYNYVSMIELSDEKYSGVWILHIGRKEPCRGSKDSEP
jgi:hypothetical protein